ncbi:MAG TPA: hypothetical protein VE134_01485, partial [Methanomicrobiales archaeon]|nr:hypothetical protein [Methanomicrobiales archaeon]
MQNYQKPMGTALKDSHADSGEVTPLQEIDLDFLSSIHDERDSCISIYSPMTRRVEKERSRIFSTMRMMEQAVPEDLRESYQGAAAIAGEALALPPIEGEVTRVVFVSVPISFYHVYRLGVELPPLVVLDATPALLPLARLNDAYADYGVLLLDSREARLFTVRSRSMREVEHMSADI